MTDEGGLSPAELQELRDFAAIIDAIDAGVPLEGRFTAKGWTIDVEPREYTSDDLKAVWARLGASQLLLAEFLGVTPDNLRCWERGVRPVPRMAARFLDEVQQHPEIWAARLRRRPRGGAP